MLGVRLRHRVIGYRHILYIGSVGQGVGQEDGHVMGLVLKSVIGSVMESVIGLVLDPICSMYMSWIVWNGLIAFPAY